VRLGPLSIVEPIKSWSKLSRWSWLAWALSACSSPVSLGDVRDTRTTSMAGSAGASGSGGQSGSSGGGGTSGAAGTSGEPAIDAATDIAPADGAAGSNADGAAGAAGRGGNAGGGGAPNSDGAAGAGGHPDASDGGHFTQPSCAPLLAMVNPKSWIAFDSDRDNYRRNIYMMHPDGSELTQLTQGANVNREPFFSYDGTRLVYTSTVAGTPHIFILDLATRTPVQLTHRSEGADQAAFSRDGQWVTFRSNRTIFVIKTDGTGERVVIGPPSGDGADYRWPTFGPDGSEVVFDRHNYEIVATKVDGSGLRPLVNGSAGWIRGSAVSPAGTDVAFALDCNPPPLIGRAATTWIWISSFTATIETCKGQVPPVTPADGFDAERPTWGNDTVLAYRRYDRSSNIGVLAMISRTDARPCLLTTGPYDSANPSWSR
jgi:Tol biopolymer transport system component